MSVNITVKINIPITEINVKNKKKLLVSNNNNYTPDSINGIAIIRDFNFYLKDLVITNNNEFKLYSGLSHTNSLIDVKVGGTKKNPVYNRVRTKSYKISYSTISSSILKELNIIKIVYNLKYKTILIDKNGNMFDYKLNPIKGYELDRYNRLTKIKKTV